MDDRIPTVSGKTIWRESTVRSILKNEKYIGDALLQKEYVADYLTGKRMLNTGDLPQYYVERNHEAIISREDFEKVQEEFLRRCRDRYKESEKPTQYAFTNHLYCSCCGNTYRRVKANGTNRHTTWRCKTHMQKASLCDSPVLKETQLQEAMLKALQILNETDPTIPAVDEYRESTMIRILEQVIVNKDHLFIRFIGENAVQVGYREMYERLSEESDTGYYEG